MAAIDTEHPGWLDRDDVAIIREEVGAPPPPCLPIYIISAGSGPEERPVYIGKTSSLVSRFAGGHAAVTKLHAPQYSALEKSIYLGCVMLLTEDAAMQNGGYLPLEWVNPLAAAVQLLADVERALIFDLQPELNTHHRQSYRPVHEVSILIENHLDNRFLSGRVVNPEPTKG